MVKFTNSTPGGQNLWRMQSSCPLAVTGMYAAGLATTTHLLQYLVERKLISPHQFGFMPQKSTTLQLLYLTDRWFRALERGKNITAVFLDFRKAFDRVWHPGLLYQLSTLISEWSAKWLTSYLSERQSSVRVGSTMSEYKTITCGVPQGSHHGPVLFIVFINNLPSTVSIPTEIMLMTLPCTMSTANSLHVQHIQLYRRRSIAPKSGLNLGMANLVMQRRGSCRPTKISCLKPLLRQWKNMQLQ